MTIEIIEEVMPGTSVIEEIVNLQLSVIEGDTAAAEAAAAAAETARTAAETARDKSQDWAESPTEPGGVGTKSAKTWALEAAKFFSIRKFLIPTEIRDRGFIGDIYYRLSTREITTDYDFDALPNSIGGNTAYIDPSNPNTGDGSIGNPFQSYITALANSSFNIYLFKSNSITKGVSAQVSIPTRNIKLGTYGGSSPAQITSEIPLTWTAHATLSGVWQATNPSHPLLIGSGMDEFNLDYNGNPSGFNRRTSIALVDSNPNSFFYDSSEQIVYVRTFDSRQPDSNVRMFLNSTILRLIRFGSNTILSKLYIENLHFYGGQPIIGQNSQLIEFGAKNCRFAYSGQKDAVFFSGGVRGFLINCESYYTIGDGFNYNSSVGSFIFEYGCRSEFSTLQDISNNGSTSHGDFRVLRVNGIYRYHSGKAVQDINNSFTVSINCKVGFGTGPSPHDYSFASNSSSGFTIMHLLMCSTSDPRGYDNFNNSRMLIYDGELGNLLTKENRDQVGSELVLLTENQVLE